MKERTSINIKYLIEILYANCLGKVFAKWAHKIHAGKTAKKTFYKAWKMAMVVGQSRAMIPR